jgi:phage FluMu protein gp41
MDQEKGKLAVGIEYDGRIHKDFMLRPQIVRDSIEAMENERAQKSNSYFGLCLLTKQIVKLGEVPQEKITPDLVMQLTDVDFEILVKAKEALESRLRSFLAKAGNLEKTGAGAA